MRVWYFLPSRLRLCHTFEPALYVLLGKSERCDSVLGKETWKKVNQLCFRLFENVGFPNNSWYISAHPLVVQQYSRLQASQADKDSDMEALRSTKEELDVLQAKVRMDFNQEHCSLSLSKEKKYSFGPTCIAYLWFCHDWMLVSWGPSSVVQLFCCPWVTSASPTDLTHQCCSYVKSSSVLS